MAKRKKKKSKKTRSVSSPAGVRRAKAIIKRHTAKLKKEKAKQEKALSATNRELRDLKHI